MYNVFAAYMLVALQNLSENSHCFILGEPIGMSLHVLCQSTTLQQFGNQIDVCSKRSYFEQFDNVLTARCFYLTKLGQSGDLTAKQILCDFIINVFEVDCFDCNFATRVVELVAEVYVPC